MIPIGKKGWKKGKIIFGISFKRHRMQKLYKNAYQMKDEIEHIYIELIFIDSLHSTPFWTDIENKFALFSETFFLNILCRAR